MNKYDHNEGEIRLRWKAELFREGPEESKEEQELHRKNEGLRRLGFKVGLPFMVWVSTARTMALRGYSRLCYATMCHNKTHFFLNRAGVLRTRATTRPINS